MTGSPNHQNAINGENTAYLGELYTQWLEDPSTVHPDYDTLFATMGDPTSGETGLQAPTSEADLRDERLKEAFRLCGHLQAELDPLGLRPARQIDALTPDSRTDPALLARLKRAYCGPIGAEFMHLQDSQQRQWWIDRLEEKPATALPLSQERILSLLTHAEGFETFCQQRFTGMRRFGLEGGESLIVALQALLNEAARDGVRSISLGMPHRGRLNVMANILRKPYAAIFSEFAGKAFYPEGIRVSGDVKYHLGTTTTIRQGRHEIRISLLPNPSHLEAVDPVVLGRVRADQDKDRDEDRQKHLGILVHGDAAFAGQGVVYETLQLSRLEGYRTGGTVHLIINNQVGFTTSQDAAHSGIWNTDVAKTVQAPILHVNGDNPEAVARCAALAHEWRKTFASDIVVDIISYRRHGHNETDDPAFTQPAMVQTISQHPTLRTLYAKKILAETDIHPAEVDALWDDVQSQLHRAFEEADTYQPDPTDWLDYSPQDPTRLLDTPERIQPMTGVPLPRLQQVGEAITTIPADFTVHPRLARLLKAKQATLAAGGPVDWATAEALAFGTLALDGHAIRLSGQDCGRGTFSQRHAVLTDQHTGHHYTPLAHIAPHQAPVNVWNSPLSEYGVMGFEYGYSLGNPDALVLWEGQFGDFANGAQIIIDQFLAAGETKWLRTSGLTLLLPHGYEGAGPEHSSARPERFLQLCAENNMRVCMPSSPASFFHLLRRQIVRRCRKPLIVFSPKSLLRHKQAVSLLGDMGPQTRFIPIIADATCTGGAKRVILCSGKVYYDLIQKRDEAGLKHCAIIRLEQLYPFPHHALAEELSHHPQAESVIWCQEEPENGGAWQFVDRRIEACLREAGHTCTRPHYAGRKASASPATGLPNIHQTEQDTLVRQALGLEAAPSSIH